MSQSNNEAIANPEGIVIDGNIISAKADYYINFAMEIGKKMNIYKNQEDLNETKKILRL